MTEPTATSDPPAPCPTCDRAGCDRCHHTGRAHTWLLTITRAADGRSQLMLTWGPPGTHRPVLMPTEAWPSIEDDTADDLAHLLTTAGPGFIVRDRRQP